MREIDDQHRAQDAARRDHPARSRLRSNGVEGATAALVFVPHTTAGVTINEHADPAVARDLEAAMERDGAARTGAGSTSRTARRTRRRTCAPRSPGPQVLVPIAGRPARARHLAGDLLLRVRRPAEAQGLRHASDLIEVENLTKRFRKTVAVDDLSFKIREGAITGFLGPERRGEDDDAARDPRPRSPDRRQGDRHGAALPSARVADAAGRGGARGDRLPSRAAPGEIICGFSLRQPEFRARGSRRFSRSSTFRMLRDAAPGVTRSECASASASQGRCSAIPASSCSTSRRTGSTHRESVGFASFCARLRRRGGRSSSRVTSWRRSSRSSTRS